MYLPLIAIFVAISGSMGVSYMTENAHPGDALYSIKVQIHELKLTQPVSESGTHELLASSNSSSSDSLYLRASREDTTEATTSDNSDSLKSQIGLTASASATSNKVINTK